MINIIEHLWQYEVPSCLIAPTAIKIAKNPVKAYFYSERAGRVLRKKQHSSEMVAQVMKMKEIPKQQFLVLIIDKKRQILPKLMIENEVMEVTENENIECVVLGIESGTNINRIYECKLTQKQFKATKLLELNQGKWRNIEKEAQQKIQEILKQKCIEFLDKLLSKLAIKDKLINFEVIIGTNESHQLFYCLWSNQLVWSNVNFHQISYKFKEQSPNQIRNIQSVSQQSVSFSLISAKQEYFKEQDHSISKQQNSDTKPCKACNKNAPLSSMIEIANEDIIKLRRLFKLSIMGINKQFDEVCPQCCEKLDSL